MLSPVCDGQTANEQEWHLQVRSVDIMMCVFPAVETNANGIIYYIYTRRVASDTLASEAAT